MNIIIRCSIALLSIGWLAPVSLAFFAVRDFEWRILRPMVFFNDASSVTPFHLIELAGWLYGIGAIWLVLIVIGWSFYLTRPTRKPI